MPPTQRPSASCSDSRRAPQPVSATRRCSRRTVRSAASLRSRSACQRMAASPSSSHFKTGSVGIWSYCPGCYTERTLAGRDRPSPLAFGPIPPAATLKSVGRFYSRAELLEQRQRWKREGKTVVFTNGCYDLLHPGHIRLLEQARSLGDVLILALNSDASTRRAKGPARPLIPERERAELALALEAVDAVTLFDEDTPRELISLVLPDVLVKGADWSHFVAGREEVEAAGGKVLTVALEPGYSTTIIIERILDRT